MALTAEEWLALPIEEGDRRADELSPHEAFRLRTELSYWPEVRSIIRMAHVYYLN